MARKKRITEKYVQFQRYLKALRELGDDTEIWKLNYREFTAKWFAQAAAELEQKVAIQRELQLGFQEAELKQLQQLQNDERKQHINDALQKAEQQRQTLRAFLEQKIKKAGDHHLFMYLHCTKDDGGVSIKKFSTRGSNVPELLDSVMDRIKQLAQYAYIAHVEVHLENIWINNIRSFDARTIKMYDTNWQIYNNTVVDQNPQPAKACVPMFLFKTYSRLSLPEEERSKKTDKRIDITLEDVVEILSNEPYREENLRRGYDTMDILRFCQKLRIKMIAVDALDNILATHSKDCKKNMPTLMYRVACDHMYIIKRTFVQVEQTTAQQLRVADIKRQNKEEQKKRETRPLIVVDRLPAPMPSGHRIWVQQPDVVDKYFHRLLDERIICTNRLVMKDNLVVEFEDHHNNWLKFYPDYWDVQAMLPKMTGIEVPPNASLHQLAFWVWKQKFGGRSSHLSHHSEVVYNRGFGKKVENRWYALPTPGAHIEAADFHKFYASCLRDAEMPWSIHSSWDAPQPYDGRLTAGAYYVVTDKSLLFPSGNAWYMDEQVAEGIRQGIPLTIVLQLKPTETRPPGWMQPFVKYIFEEFRQPKKSIVGMVGYLNQREKKISQHHYDTRKDVFLSAMVDNLHVHMEPVKTAEDLKEGNDAELFHMWYAHNQSLTENYLPLGRKVYAVAAVKLFRLCRKIEQLGGRILAIKTDTLIVEGVKDVFQQLGVLGDEIGQLDLLPQAKLASLLRSAKLPAPEYPIGHDDWNEWLPPPFKYLPLVERKDGLGPNFEEHIQKNEGFSIEGRAGTGKSYWAHRIMEYLGQEKIDFRQCSPSNKAARLLHGSTIHRLFNLPLALSANYNVPLPIVKALPKWIIIDEISMVSEVCWIILARLKRTWGFNFILLGDWNQIPPVREKKRQGEYLINYLCDFQGYTLQRCYRTLGDDEAEQLFKDHDLVLEGRGDEVVKRYPQAEHPRSICYTHRVRKMVNQMWNSRLAAKVGGAEKLADWGYLYTGLPVVATENNDKLAKNECYTVTKCNRNSCYVTLTCDGQEVQLTKAELKTQTCLGYCTTNHSTQGTTIREPYTIYEADIMDPAMLYTAMSRTSKRSLIHFAKAPGESRQSVGWIYMIRNRTTLRGYVGSTTKTPQDRYAGHLLDAATDCKQLYQEIKKDPKNFELIPLKEVKLWDDDVSTLRKWEMIMINRYNTIAEGYNLRAEGGRT